MGDTGFNDPWLVLCWSNTSSSPALACRVLNKCASYIAPGILASNIAWIARWPIRRQEEDGTCACLISLDSVSPVNKRLKGIPLPCHLVPQSTRACLRLKVDAARKNQWTYADVSEIISLANLCLDCSYICILRAFRTRTVFAWLWLVAGADLLWENSTANCLLAGGWC